MLDHGFDLYEIDRLIIEKSFTLMGFAAGLILLLLAITVIDFFMRKMGMRWKSLHRLEYTAGIVVILHYALAKKGNLFTFSSDIIQPLLWELVVVLLLVLRLPVVRKWFSRFR